MHVYHYGGNNPIRYVDPNGEFIELSSRFSRTVVIGKIPILIRGEVNLSRSGLSYEASIGVGVGVGGGQIFSVNFHDLEPIPETNTRFEIFSDASVSAAPLVGEMGLNTTFTYYSTDGVDVQTNYGSTSITVTPQLFTTTEMTINPDGTTTLKDSFGINYGAETSLMLLGVRIRGGVNFED
jgi:hypothetical protein